MSDPFTMVYETIRDLVLGSSVISELVRPANFPDLDQTPQKEEIHVADTPEIIIIPSGGEVNLHNTSSTSYIKRLYTIAISTASRKPSEKLHPVEFALFAQMANWPHVISALEWEGEGFVKKVNITSCEQGESDPEKNRGIKGWSALWTIDVDMYFKTRNLILYGASGETGSGSGS